MPLWVTVLVTFPLMMAAGVALGLLWEYFSSSPLRDMPAISFLAVLLWLWIVAAVGIKRLHDCDRALPIAGGALLAVMIASANDSAAAVLPAIGLAGVFVLVALGFLKGTQGPNRYGPDPLEAKAGAAS